MIRRIPVFDARKESWKRILLTKGLSSCVNNLLISPFKISSNNDKIVGTLVDERLWSDLIKDINGYELEWKAGSPALWLNRYLDYTLKLWRNYREDILDEFSNDNRTIFEQSEERRFLTINGVNYYYAIPIFFRYKYNDKEYRFAWQTWGWIDMYDGNKKLYDLYYSKYEKAFNIEINKDVNATSQYKVGIEYFIKKMEGCINSYENFISGTESTSSNIITDM